MTDGPISADENELGDLLGVYRGQGTASLIAKLLGGAVFALASVGLVGWAAFSTFRDLGNLAEDGAFAVFFMPGLLCFLGLAILPFGAWLLISVRKSIGLSARAYTEGFAITRRGKTDIFRWEDVSEFIIAPYTIGSTRAGRAHYLSYHVKRKDGLTVVLDQADMPGAPVLGERVANEVSERLLPRMIAAIERGELLTFGDRQSGFTVSRRGIQRKDAVLAWGEIAGVRLDARGNGLIIMQRGAPDKRDRRWARFLLSGIPNAAVFVKLVNQVRSQR